MVSVVNPSSEKSIQKLWTTYHTINIIAACTAVPLWFFTPFLTHDIDSNGFHKFFRGFSIVYGLSASGVTLILSSELTKLKPKIDALNKREQAEFKHSLASDLWLAQGRNTAIAQLLLSDAVPSAPSEDVRNPEGTLEEEYSDLKDTPSRPSKTSEGTLSRVREGEGFQSLKGISDYYNRRLLKPLIYAVFKVRSRQRDLNIPFQASTEQESKIKKR